MNRTTRYAFPPKQLALRQPRCLSRDRRLVASFAGVPACAAHWRHVVGHVFSALALAPPLAQQRRSRTILGSPRLAMPLPEGPASPVLGSDLKQLRPTRCFWKLVGAHLARGCCSTEQGLWLETLSTRTALHRI